MNQTEIVPEINIEEIMQAIRQQVMAKKAAQSGAERPVVQVEGKRFSPQFYEHLYQAGLTYDQLEVPVFVSESSLPLLGPVVQWLRQKVHELVAYYVNQIAANQVRVNTHLLQAIGQMSEALEEEALHDDEIAG